MTTPEWVIKLNPANASETVYKQWGKDCKYFATAKEAIIVSYQVQSEGH